VFRIRFQSFVTATTGGAAFDSIHHTGFAPAVSVRGSRRIVNFVADPGRSMNPLAGSNEAVVPSALIETIAAFSIDPASTTAEGYAFLTELVRRLASSGRSIVEVPIVFRDRQFGTSKMSGRIIAESMLLVTRWGVSDLVHGRRPSRRR
jgi:hypothetical protein